MAEGTRGTPEAGSEETAAAALLPPRSQARRSHPIERSPQPMWRGAELATCGAATCPGASRWQPQLTSA